MPPLQSWCQRFMAGSLAIGVGAVGALDQAALAVQLADGATSFVQMPRLLNVKTTNKSVGSFWARYYFTVSVPADAGEPLQRVVINQRDGVDDVEFAVRDTEAFADQGRKTRLALGTVTEDRREDTVVVTFDPPVSPGQTVTLSLRPRRNPYASGVYLFGVTAFPQGEKARGQFLGYGRLHFYNDYDGFSPFSSRHRWRSPFYHYNPFF